MTNAIEVTDLRKSYGDFDALRGVSFTVAVGEVFCLLGPNGAGKTTTTEILEGYRSRDGGSVSVLGLDPAHGPRQLREHVGIVLQSCGLQDDLTVTELLTMYRRYQAPRRRGCCPAVVGHAVGYLVSPVPHSVASRGSCNACWTSPEAIADVVVCRRRARRRRVGSLYSVSSAGASCRRCGRTDAGVSA